MAQRRNNADSFLEYVRTIAKDHGLTARKKGNGLRISTDDAHSSARFRNALTRAEIPFKDSLTGGKMHYDILARRSNPAINWNEDAQELARLLSKRWRYVKWDAKSNRGTAKLGSYSISWRESDNDPGVRVTFDSFPGIKGSPESVMEALGHLDRAFAYAHNPRKRKNPGHKGEVNPYSKRYTYMDFTKKFWGKDWRTVPRDIRLSFWDDFKLAFVGGLQKYKKETEG
jgi:hypothetical protein